MNVFNLNNPSRVDSKQTLLDFIEQCETILPHTHTVHYTDSKVLSTRDFTFDKVAKLSIVNHPTGSKKDFWKSMSLSLYHPDKKKYLELFKLTYPNNNGKFVLETFVNGYERLLVDPERKEFCEDDLCYKTYKFGKYEVFFLSKDDNLTHIGVFHNNILYKFFTINDDKAESHVPITNKDETSVSKSFLVTIGGAFTYVIMAYLYFNSLIITMAIALFSMSALAINDYVNPKRHPFWNIVQAVIYALIFFFVK